LWLLLVLPPALVAAAVAAPRTKQDHSTSVISLAEGCRKMEVQSRKLNSSLCSSNRPLQQSSRYSHTSLSYHAAGMDNIHLARAAVHHLPHSMFCMWKPRQINVVPLTFICCLLDPDPRTSHPPPILPGHILEDK
jgi:hypothetical protein